MLVNDFESNVVLFPTTKQTNKKSGLHVLWFSFLSSLLLSSLRLIYHAVDWQEESEESGDERRKGRPERCSVLTEEQGENEPNVYQSGI